MSVKDDKMSIDPETYMRMAIDVMNQSVSEPRNDGKESPKVGAVLIKPDGSIETASRGELRFGDHAEFTLLERKNRSARLDGSILFATLEPCAPGARKHPKLGCAERIVNARISEVWIGIEDPDPLVDRKGIKFLQKHGIKVHMFFPQYQKIIRESNKLFLAQALARAEYSQNNAVQVLSILENVVPSITLSDLSNEAMEYYIKEANLSFSINSDEFFRHFEQVGLIRQNEKSSLHGYGVTGNGALLFGKNPQAIFPQSSVKASVRYGSNDSIPKDFSGPLVLLPGEIEMWLEKVLHSTANRESFTREDKTQFPLQPLREAIINAIAHRDYELNGAKTYIRINDISIIVKSAGLPVNPITLEDIKSFNAPSLSRNPVLTYVFSQMNLMEESELGMETFRTMQIKYDLPLPIYTFEKNYLSLTFPRSIQSIKDLSGNESFLKLNTNEIKVYQLFRDKKSLSKANIVSLLSVSQRTAERILQRLVSNNFIRKVGAGSTTTYSIIE